MMKSISANELSTLLSTGNRVEMIDVRTPVEYRAMHVTVARNIPLDRLEPMAIQSSRNGSSSDPLYVVCRSGSRSRQACEKLTAAGVANIINVEGGTMACAAAGAPIVKGKNAIPLNCLVQIITGLAVLAGAVVAVVTSNLYWLSLPIVMGAGLVFSGLTNTCAMGTMLARMPWNQVKPEASQPAATSTNTRKDAATGCCN
jgi:rhodanese-related sulfurtransferase